MINYENVIALRMERQHLIKKANETEYIDLYRDTQPGQNVYWNGFGNPPSLTYRADFDDIEFNRERQKSHALLKGRFSGGNIGWIVKEDLELYACLFCKTLDKPTTKQLLLLELIERKGSLNIQQMKKATGMLVKEITPALHRLQKAFLIYEDQYDGKWDRGWHKFSAMFPNVDLAKYSQTGALKILLPRFAYRHVLFDIKMVKSFYRVSEKKIKEAISILINEGLFVEFKGSYMLHKDLDLLCTYKAKPPKSIFAMHRNDFLVKSCEHWLKERFLHSYPDTLYYILIDGKFRGAVVGKFRYTPEVEDVILDLSKEEAAVRKDEILKAIYVLCGSYSPIRRYQGNEIV